MDEVMAAPDAPPPSVALVSAGGSHSVALLSDNMLRSWGRGEDGQLGHGDAYDRLVPTVLSGFEPPGITLVICGADHTTAYSKDERLVYSWGWGDFGRLGHGNSSDVFTPQQGLKIMQIACGDSHCLAVTMDGEVHSWGRNQNYSLVWEPRKIHCSHKRFKLLRFQVVGGTRWHLHQRESFMGEDGTSLDKLEVEIMKIIVPQYRFIFWRSRKFPKLLADGGIPLPIPKGKMFSRGEGVLADSLVMEYTNDY